MVKKRIQQIWQAGLEDFAARRAKVQSGRGARAARAGIVADLGRESAVKPSPRQQALGREADEGVRRAVLEAIAPLHRELAAVKEEVADLRARLEVANAAAGERKAKAAGKKH
ncbi:hypothetical protein IP91_01198 [Pseudoduganella lurida]|uniref:Uncharacterized protein n=1 Tax=Pseudoduganella lurida TaxID=1036180 RepID=A0A562RM36_9BURK|nr:hypothetical protein [Pseudoduganella lurida]TWI70118.1 hypothetical protein IP91_01198 [Pseudoduganella lurida]